MAGNTKHALPEHWTELINSRANRQICADEVKEIKISCATKCGKKHVSECPQCFAKVLDKMRSRYCDASGRQWFSQRRAFLIELESLFADVQARKTDLMAIEARIDSEKEAWYRWVLRTYPDFLGVADSGVDRSEIRSMLGDPDRPRPDLIKMVWEGVGQPSNWSDELDRFASKVAAVKDDPAALKRLYVEEFFKKKPGDSVVENAQKYLEAYEASESVALESIIDRIAQDHRASLNSQPQRDDNQRRLDELRRAKTAFEQNRMQAKSQAAAAAAQMPSAAEELYDLPPCAVCGAKLGDKNIISCSLCQVVTRLSGKNQLTVFCSEECFHKGNEDHIDKEHDCDGGDTCAQYDDEDTEMNDDVEADTTVACNECLEKEKKATIWCSEKCANKNIGRHREKKHNSNANEQINDVSKLICSLRELTEKTLKEANPGVKFSPVN